MSQMIIRMPRHTHKNQYEPANRNIQAHISSVANPHNVTAAQAGAAASVHDHNASYYTKSEIDTMLAVIDGGTA